MGCATCGQSNSNTSGGGSGCCNLRAMDVDTPLANIQNGDKNFCFTEITDKICESLANDEGIHPSATNQNSDCDDLSSINDLATGSLHNALMTLNMCDVDAYKCWLDSLLSWQWNVDKAIICAICGIWEKIHCLDEKEKYLQCQIDMMKDILLGLVYNNVDTKGSYVVQQETPNLSVVVNKDGSFRYEWSDWNTAPSPWVELGHGVLTGKVNFTMAVNKDGGLDYHITSIHIGTITYTTKNAGWSGSEPRYYILVPADGTQRWTRNGTVNSSWSVNVNANYPFDSKGTISPNQESANIAFMTWGADWETDDKVKLQFKFINNNGKVDLDCPAPDCKVF